MLAKHNQIVPLSEIRKKEIQWRPRSSQMSTIAALMPTTLLPLSSNGLVPELIFNTQFCIRLRREQENKIQD
jgi:hypothetical protein